MLIHDDDVRRLGVPPRLEHTATRELGTLCSQAIFAGGGNLRPYRGLFGQIGKLGEIAGFGGRGPSRNARERARGAALAPEQRSLLRREFQPMPAEIVGAAFEQSDLRG